MLVVAKLPFKERMKRRRSYFVSHIVIDFPSCLYVLENATLWKINCFNTHKAAADYNDF